MKRTCKFLVALCFVRAACRVGRRCAGGIDRSARRQHAERRRFRAAQRRGMPGGGELARIMLQAYLGADGRALVRAWDPSRDAYTAPAERRWSLSGSTFCLDVPMKPAPTRSAPTSTSGGRGSPGLGSSPLRDAGRRSQPGQRARLPAGDARSLSPRSLLAVCGRDCAAQTEPPHRRPSRRRDLRRQQLPRRDAAAEELLRAGQRIPDLVEAG
jgi:hypothetical protein